MIDELRSLEDEWAAIIVRRDVEAARELLADDFVLSSAGGVAQRMPKIEWLEALGAIETRSLVAGVEEVRLFGNVAVVRATLRWDASLGDRDLTGEYVVADVFTRGADRWRASWRISTRAGAA